MYVFFSLSPSNATDFESTMFDCSRRVWPAIPGLPSHWSFIFLKMVYLFFPLCVLSLSRHPNICFTVWKNRWRKRHTFLWWNFQQIPPWDRRVQRWVSGVCRIRQLPPFHLLAWIETGSCSFLFLDSLLAEKCSFEWTEMIYKAQLNEANSTGEIIKK